MSKLSKENLQPLFASKVLELKSLTPGYDNTNDVYFVRTDEGQYVIKILKDTSENRSVFWRGLHLVFGTTYEASINNQKGLSEYLNKLNVIPVPRILKAESSLDNPIQKPYVIMEWMRGIPVLNESELFHQMTQDKEVAYQLGIFLSKIHARQFDYFGNIEGQGRPLSEFPEKLALALKTLGAMRKAAEDRNVQRVLPHFIRQAQMMRPPKSSGLIMLDLWPTQFLASQQGSFAALVDIESYAIGPIELELVLIELWLGNHGKFKEGYFETGAKWPDLEELRELYRFFLYLLYDCPAQGLDACIDSRSKFPQRDRLRKRSPVPKPRLGGPEML